MIKTFYISIAGVKTENEGVKAVGQTREIALDVVSSLKYILANKYKIKMIDYNCLRVEIKSGGNDA